MYMIQNYFKAMTTALSKNVWIGSLSIWLIFPSAKIIAPILVGNLLRFGMPAIELYWNKSEKLGI